MKLKRIFAASQKQSNQFRGIYLFVGILLLVIDFIISFLYFMKNVKAECAASMCSTDDHLARPKVNDINARNNKMRKTRKKSNI